jgi:hypothetical protein
MRSRDGPPSAHEAKQTLGGRSLAKHLAARDRRLTGMSPRTPTVGRTAAGAIGPTTGNAVRDLRTGPGKSLKQSLL